MQSRRNVLKTSIGAALVSSVFPVHSNVWAVEPAAGGSAAAESPLDKNFIWGRKLRKIADQRVIHRFFDTSPVSPSGRYVALIRFGDETKSPKPGDLSDIVVVDLRRNTERVVAQTRGFELQLGAQVQWGRTDRDLFFSDVDLQTWKSKTVILNPRSGKRRVLSGPLFMVSADGRQFCGYDMTTSRFAQVGYGVMVPNDKAPRVAGPSPNNGVYVTDVRTGQSKLVASSKAIFDAISSTIDIGQPESLEFYVFQVKWNPQGTRLLISYQWSLFGRGDRRRAAITMRSDGTEIKVAIRPEQWARGGHHICWMPDGEHISMNLNIDDEPGIELVSFKYDGTELKKIYDPGSGHPSQHPAGLPLFVTDAYPTEPMAREPGIVPIRLINVRTQTEEKIAEVYVSEQGGEFRIDPHPAWDRTGRQIIFNGYVGDTRNVWSVDIGDLIDKERLRD
jgi:hypothetical protein